ncbi:hypothetical protein [Streptomyces montanisoli]|uniref:EamA/RhaT family transporter n=1 Tax=Streptomyces montanisoli TaxID=2798581 RepID=A0A940RZT4_9ACTN|nr:hypothetical protein [Streptomyces montanisoli]MBP0460583.1 hypothetical protein [Streptomyces montanisoli]
MRHAPARGTARGGGPEPEELRFFGTTWVRHDGGYAVRRVAVAAGSLVAAAASCVVLRFAYDGIALAGVGSFVGVLVVAMFAVCSLVAFRRTWAGFGERPADQAREDSLRSLKTIGFIGSLLAYFVRSLTEAPGEGLLRREYEAAVVAYEKRRGARSGNPGARAKKKRPGGKAGRTGKAAAPTENA